MTDVSELLIHIKQKEDITNTVMDFGDLVASAEQLTAEIDGAKAGNWTVRAHFWSQVTV